MNCYYKNPVKDFLAEDADAILGVLARKGGNDPRQMDAWSEEISMMRNILHPYRDEAAEVLFEYTIPRLAKRVDVVLLLRGLIFTLEFKVGEKEFRQADIEQVMDYALDLKIDVKRKIDVEHWFLEDKKDLQSSFFLEDVATEFDIQGLELDWTCVAWDGDLRFSGGAWSYYRFARNRWMHNHQATNQAYQLNAYRVLLTRARQGMALLVPHGDVEDETRDPRIYDGTFEYLKSIGLEVI